MAYHINGAIIKFVGEKAIFTYLFIVQCSMHIYDISFTSWTVLFFSILHRAWARPPLAYKNDTNIFTNTRCAFRTIGFLYTLSFQKKIKNQMQGYIYEFIVFIIRSFIFCIFIFLATVIVFLQIGWMLTSFLRFLINRDTYLCIRA